MGKKRNLKASKLLIIFAVFSGLFFSQCNEDADSLMVDSGKLSYQIMSGDISKTGTLADGITSGSYYLVNSLPSGYVKDGSRDYTYYVQAAVTKYNNIVFPAFPILVNDKGISIGSNKTITFSQGSEIRLSATSKDSYNIFNITGASNIVMYNPVIVGDRSKHIGTGGEHGMGIGIRGSSNITIYSPKITDCWGDGIYIGQAGSNINCKNIIIKDAYLRKNRRDGISIISVDGLLIDNIYAGYSDGTSPWCGINIEPNNTACVINNIRINNPRTEYNGANGIQIGTRRMLGSISKTSNITIVNHVDIGSPRYAFKMMCNSLEGTTAKQYGLIDIVNPAWNRTGTNRPLYLSTNQPTFKTEVTSPEVVNANGSLLTWASTYDLLMKESRFAALTVSNIIKTVANFSLDLQPSAEPATGLPVFAINAGGSSFLASNGINYGADEKYSRGYVYKTSVPISNTTDDALYQSERFGNFSYSIPVTSGTYEVTFKFAENYHQASGFRQFDVMAENIAVISNLDLFAAAGYNSAYDLIRTVSVTDGNLNIEFRTDKDNAKISALHVIKK